MRERRGKLHAFGIFVMGAEDTSGRVRASVIDKVVQLHNNNHFERQRK